MLTEIRVESTQKIEMIDVTDQLAEFVRDKGSGMAFFSTPHTTAALIICEDDPALHEDVVRVAGEMFAPYRPYKHIRNNNPNSEAHLLSSFAGTQLSFMMVDGNLTLGTYQRVYFLELDGARTRRIHAYVLHGE